MSTPLPLDGLNAGSLIATVPLSHVTLDVVYVGYLKGLLSAGEVVELELCRLNQGIPLSEVESCLALMLSDEFGTVPDVLAGGVRNLPLDEGRHVWLYVAVKLLRARWGGTPDAVYQLASLIEEFDTPQEYADFLYYMPSKLFIRRHGRASFLEALDDRIRIDDAEFGAIAGSATRIDDI